MYKQHRAFSWTKEITRAMIFVCEREKTSACKFVLFGPFDGGCSRRGQKAIRGTEVYFLVGPQTAQSVYLFNPG